MSRCVAFSMFGQTTVRTDGENAAHGKTRTNKA